MLGLSASSLLALGAEAVLGLSEGTRVILGYADVLVCAFFLLDFLYQLWRAPNRARYFASWGWLDLASSIPFVDALRLGRVGRMARIVRVLRGAQSTRRLASYFLARRAQSAVFAAALVSIILIVFASAAVLQFESGIGNIKTPEDAVWWALSTITTVGFGDLFPVTTEGRVVAVLLMTAGIGLFATFSGFLVSWFLAPQEAERENEIRALRADIAELRVLLKQQRGVGDASDLS